MKLSERIKNKKKFIIGVVIGIVVVNIIGIAGAIAASVTSDVVIYTGNSQSTVKGALDDLYTKASTHCPDGYNCTKNPSVGNITSYAPNSSDTHLGIAYFDPTNLSTSCNASNSSIGATGTTSGCMKWYIYKEDTNYYYAILDHNTTAYVSSFSAAQTQVTADTSRWVSSLKPRNITANEIAGITGNTSWSQSTSTDWFYFEGNDQTGAVRTRQNKYAWLYDYTCSCRTYGCNTNDSSTCGYWTSDYKAGDTSSAWYVPQNGSLSDYPVSSNGVSSGVRPVVSISKS